MSKVTTSRMVATTQHASRRRFAAALAIGLILVGVSGVLAAIMIETEETLSIRTALRCAGPVFLVLWGSAILKRIADDPNAGANTNIALLVALTILIYLLVALATFALIFSI